VNTVSRFRQMKAAYSGIRWILVLPVWVGLAHGTLAATEDPWTRLEARGAVISGIEIHVADVFDLSDPEENHFVGRTLNALHITSRPESIRPALLFGTGPVRALRIHATERLLRSLPSVRDARIEPRENPDGTVTAVVRVRDAWSLKLRLEYSHSAGQNEWHALAREYNFLGRLKQIMAGYGQTSERTYTRLAYEDPFLMGSRWRGRVEYRDLSDGYFRQAEVSRPFHDVLTPWSAGLSAGMTRSDQTFYENDREVFDLPSRYASVSLFGRLTFWQQGRYAQRAGLEFLAVQRRYSAPVTYLPDILPLPAVEDRRYRGFLADWSLFEDRHITRRNVENLDAVEDFNLGWELDARLGYFPRALGSRQPALYAELAADKGWILDRHAFALGHFQWQHRREAAGRHVHRTEFRMTVYDQRLPWQTLLAEARGAFRQQPDPEDMLYLGGNNGLRGYKNHFRIGTDRWLVTLEDRVITGWRFWGLVEIGFVGYLEAGAIRELATRRWSRTYVAAGGGLRIGNLKSAFGRVISITVATPLVRERGVDGIQLVIGTGEPEDSRPYRGRM